MPQTSRRLHKLLTEVRASTTAQLLIVGQAPGTCVHAVSARARTR